MKPIKAPVIPLFWVCAISIALRLIPQTLLWSPLPWRYGQMFGVNSPIAFAVLLVLTAYAGFAGMEAVKRLASVLLPLILGELIIVEILLFTTGIAVGFMPLLALMAVSADFVLFSVGFVWFFRLFAKSGEKSEKVLDK